tara:strand:- start:73 stop:501 length:429 start_codon:yes stop_codon:yes gene_type:complete
MKSRYNKGGKSSSPISELLRVLNEGGVNFTKNGEQQSSEEGSSILASERYIDKALRGSMPDMDRAKFQSELASDRAFKGETAENQAASLYNMLKGKAGMKYKKGGKTPPTKKEQAAMNAKGFVYLPSIGAYMKKKARKQKAQ